MSRSDAFIECVRDIFIFCLIMESLIEKKKLNPSYFKLKISYLL